MSTVYDAIMWIFGRDANRNIARQNNGPNDQIVPRHAGRDNNLAMVLFQQLVQDDAQPKDYLIAACYFLQIVAFFYHHHCLVIHKNKNDSKKTLH